MTLALASAVTERAAWEPRNKGACDSQSESGEGIGDVALRPRCGTRTFALGVGLRGKNAAHVPIQ